MSQNEEISILPGIAPAQRGQAGLILWEGFKEKFRSIFGSGEKFVQVVETGIQPERIVTACVNGHLAGVAGLSYSGKSSVVPDRETVQCLYGSLKALYRYPMIVFALHNPHKDMDGLYLETIAVDPALRGHGIGSRLLEEVERIACENGLKSVTLDVVDTNPGAIRLYARCGYRNVKYQNLFFMKPLMGFSGVYEMRKDL
jgi:ribosomal protein S18 acetylase RimI-like enzyme